MQSVTNSHEEITSAMGPLASSALTSLSARALVAGLASHTAAGTPASALPGYARAVIAHGPAHVASLAAHMGGDEKDEDIDADDDDDDDEVDDDYLDIEEDHQDVDDDDDDDDDDDIDEDEDEKG